MKKLMLLCLFWAVAVNISISQPSDSAVIKNIHNYILTNGAAYDWLDHLSNNIGGRLSGSPEAEQAVKWSKMVMDTLGLDSVWLQPVMVPHWVRGEREVAKIISKSGNEAVNICALGGSVGTEKKGLKAEVIEVKSFEELEELGREKVQGKIVFFNTPMDQTYINTFNAYGNCGSYRVRGASNAAEYGAVGSITRSLTLVTDEHPHTGSMKYSDDTSIPKIPAAAISTLHADLLSKMLKDDPKLKFYYRMNCDTFPDVLSYNVIGEIKGSQYPDEIVLVGAHLDSWDIGDGSHDDGAGCVQSLEVLRTFNELGLKPKRTIRTVLFMNEENGTRGAKKYAAEVKEKGENHIAAIESDRGGFSPRGFDINDSMTVVNSLQAYLPLLEPYYLHLMEKGYGGVDINYLKETGTTCIGLQPDTQRYFDHHHAHTDTFDAINKRELHMGAAAMASLAWLISEYGIRTNVN